MLLVGVLWASIAPSMSTPTRGVFLISILPGCVAR